MKLPRVMNFWLISLNLPKLEQAAAPTRWPVQVLLIPAVTARIIFASSTRLSGSVDDWDWLVR